MKYEDERRETPFETRDHMLDIRQHLEELCFRGFGLRKRKAPKIPGNFSEWSPESQERWKNSQAEMLEWQQKCDRDFVEEESKWMRQTAREIVNLIDRANRMSPQTEHECDIQRDMQNEALGLCSNMERELNHIAATIPCNKNFAVKLTKDIEHEIALIQGWRKSCNPIRAEAMKKDAIMRMKATEAARQG